MFRRILACAVMLGLGACSSIVEGTDQSVTVVTDPAGAMCELKRDGATIGVANPTPASVHVEKSKDDISVECQKEGYQRGANTLASGFQGMTFGNIIFGGIIGVGIDAASGAMHEYPPNVTVVMAPESFGTPEDREMFFKRQRLRIEQEAAESVAEVHETCTANQSGSGNRCQQAVEAIEGAKEARLAALDAQESAAAIE